MKPGDILDYTLNADDAEQINRRRTTGESIRTRIGWSIGHWPRGAQAHIGNVVAEGDKFPMIVVRINDDGSLNGQVLLDGTDVLWVRNFVL